MLVMFGESSYFVYLYHLIFVTLISRLIAGFALPLLPLVLAKVLLTAALTLVAAIAIRRVIGSERASFLFGT